MIKNYENINEMNICMCHEQLIRKDCTSYLGVYLDQHLKFANHIRCVCKKVSKFVPVVYGVRHCFN